MTDRAPPGCFKEFEIIGKSLGINCGQKPINGFQIDSPEWDTLGQQHVKNTNARDFVTECESKYRYLQFLGLQEGRHAGDEQRWISGLQTQA